MAHRTLNKLFLNCSESNRPYVMSLFQKYIQDYIDYTRDHLYLFPLYVHRVLVLFTCSELSPPMEEIMQLLLDTILILEDRYVCMIE